MKRLILLLSLVFLSSLIVHFPLSLVAKYFPKIPKLELTSPSGTVWQGSFYSVQWDKKNLGSLAWKFNPIQMLLGRLNVDFTLDGQPNISAKGNAGLSFSGAYVKNMQLDLASSFIDTFIRYPLPISSTGTISFTIDDYQVAEPWCEKLQGIGRWNDASLILPIGVVNLGDVSAKLGCSAGSILLTASSDSNQLETEVSLSFSPTMRYKLEGSLAAKDNLPQAIRSQLKWLGQPDQQGRYKLAFSG